MIDILIIGLSRIVKKRVLKAISSLDYINAWECATVTQAQEARNLGAKTVYLNYEVALKKSTAQWVYISLPNAFHHKWIQIALENNKNVIVDKPAVINIDIGYELLRLAKTKNLILSEAMTFGFHDQFLYAKKLFKESNSEIKIIQSCFTIPELPETDFRSNPELGGGAYWDMASYAIGVGRVLLNELPIKLNILIADNIKRLCDIRLFSIAAQYTSGTQVLGCYGFGLEYSNTIELTGENLKVNLVRPFSMPEYMDVTLEYTTGNKKNTFLITANDSFAKYFQWVINSDSINHKELIWRDFKNALHGMDMLSNSLEIKN